MSCQRLKAFIVQKRVTKLFSLPGQSSLVLAFESGKCRLGIRRNFLPVGGQRKGEREFRDSPLWDISKRRSISCLSSSPPPSLPPLLCSAKQWTKHGALHPVPAVLLSG